jgi:hypothetical protein
MDGSISIVVVHGCPVLDFGYAWDRWEIEGKEIDLLDSWYR